MLDVISLIISSTIQVFSWSYAIKKISGKKINKNISNIFILILMTIAVIILLNNSTFLKPIILYCIMILGYKYILGISFNESFIDNFFSVVIHSISEIIMTILIILIDIKQDIIEKYIQLTPIGGLIVLFGVIILLKFFSEQVIKTKNIFLNEKVTYFFYIILIISISILLSLNINMNMDNWKNLNTFAIDIITLLMFIIVIIFLLKEKLKVYKSNQKFNDLFNKSQDVATLLEKYQKANHENKNELIIIKEKAKNNKEVVDYINSILEEKNNKKDRWIIELNAISDIGISGFLSVKINGMIDNKIKVNLIINKKVKNYNFSTLKIKEYKNLCKVLGVYLDNAQEASLESKKKEVTIEMYIENKELVIVISNTFKGKIELEELDRTGYSTKGFGRGVGLSLVKDILNSNKFIYQKREIIKNYYYQYIYIKIFDDNDKKTIKN